MRQSIIELFRKIVLFKYKLPNATVGRCIHSTIDDDCYVSADDNELSRIIYNTLIDYAFNENDMDNDLNLLHSEAISQRMRIEEEDSDETQLKYGFFGEVLLNLMLRIYYSTNAVIAKGYFYDILKPEEPKGYDSYHLIETPNETQLWFGEVKFHQSYSTAINSVYKNIQKAISDDYFRTNLLALTPKKRDLDTTSTTIKNIIEHLRKEPKITIENLKNEYKIKLIYPVFILCNSIQNYDNTISSIIKYIEDNHSYKSLNIGLEYELFFILLPVYDVKQIKQQVLKWIKLKQPLSLL